MPNRSFGFGTIYRIRFARMPYSHLKCLGLSRVRHVVKFYDYIHTYHTYSTLATYVSVYIKMQYAMHGECIHILAGSSVLHIQFHSRAIDQNRLKFQCAFLILPLFIYFSNFVNFEHSTEALTKMGICAQYCFCHSLMSMLVESSLCIPVHNLDNRDYIVWKCLKYSWQWCWWSLVTQFWGPRL